MLTTWKPQLSRESDFHTAYSRISRRMGVDPSAPTPLHWIVHARQEVIMWV